LTHLYDFKLQSVQSISDSSISCHWTANPNSYTVQPGSQPGSQLFPMANSNFQ